MMQHQKHQQVRYYNKTRDAVYVQPVPNVRRWISATVVETLSARSYKVKTIKGGIYIRNKIYQNQAHRLETES